ncbi:hypothetical protein L292_2104 [Acinetobacter junii CIP 107470 = MTCC 11364]|uniref:Uncharacterized protein n=1 Tax=Acinetobacter junii CIP 107470 = MTCC 11364 TaxID=1217666 RepID=S7WUQ8_ACIJU|nr:hypothetical protein [Acinetobacter junii]ENV52094.1 hypothetical protein F953_00506 [Acinetobacter junii CIP 107470 = MTCC 11364]EPR86870.1 hypothetical protein L292_2104 [Acinetobacter junii CIP 107470 = MTCC 11364]
MQKQLKDCVSTRLEIYIKDDSDSTQAGLIFFGNYKNIHKAEELLESYIQYGGKCLYVVGATDEIKRLYSGYTTTEINYYDNYDDAYFSIYPNDRVLN